MAQEEVVAFTGGTLRVDFGDVPRQACPWAAAPVLLWLRLLWRLSRFCLPALAAVAAPGGGGRCSRTLEPETRS